MRRWSVAGAVVAAVGLNAAALTQLVEYKSGVKWPEPPVVAPGAKPGDPPADATVLFDGTGLDAWKNGDRWVVRDGYAEVKGADISTKAKFGDVQLHLEFATPEVVKGKGQGRGNSGVFLMNRYEVQILDSFDNKTYFDGQCAALYKQQPPMANVCRKPGEWQTYDITFTAPRFAESGELAKPAAVTVFHNGVCVQNHFELKGGTYFDRPASYDKGHPPADVIRIQNHGNPVRFRNIWVRELKPVVGEPPMPKG